MRVLSITHGPSVPGGLFEELVEAEGHELERWSAPAGHEPEPAPAFDAVLLFGGAMHPDQDETFSWLAREEAFLSSVLECEIPALGVCLGAQMLARAAGAWVGPAPAPEVGWFDVELTPEGRDDPVVGALVPPVRALEWHSYTFGIPGGAAELARTATCAQAFRLGLAWGIQFHAEATLTMIERWAAEEADDLPVAPSAFVAEARSEIDRWNEQGRRLCSAFLAEAERRSGHARGAIDERAISSTASRAADT